MTAAADAPSNVLRIAFVTQEEKIYDFAIEDDRQLVVALRTELARRDASLRLIVRNVPWTVKEGTAGMWGVALDTTTDDMTWKPERWSDFDVVLVRTPWDYPSRVAEFWQWLDGLERSATTEGVPPLPQRRGVHILNDVATLRWNSSKLYLRDLMKRGVPVIPTMFVLNEDEMEHFKLTDVAKHRLAKLAPSEGPERDAVASATKYVMKPVVSNGAVGTYLVSLKESERAEILLAAIVHSGTGAMIQPYMPQVAEEGEFSFVFIDDVFSHAVIKKPKKGDFRVQENHGGTSERIESPEADLVEQAAQVLVAAHDAIGASISGKGEEPLPIRLHDPTGAAEVLESGAAPSAVVATTDESTDPPTSQLHPFTYARVDGVVSTDANSGRRTLVVMELELVEPSLFFWLSAPAADNAADATPTGGVTPCPIRLAAALLSRVCGQ